MNLRRQARQIAIEYLYQRNLAGESDRPVEEDLAVLPTAEKHAPSARPFAADLVRGVLARIETLDGKIRQYAQNWSLERIAAVDRAILRLAIYEMLFRDDIPPVVSINEAIDLAKEYSSADSGRFVNGILDRVKLELNRPLRTVAGAPRA